MANGKLSGSEAFLRKIIEDRIGVDRVDRLVPLLKGYSRDQKFVAWSHGTPRFLLRLSSPKEISRRLAEYDLLSVLAQQGIRCPRPLAAGETPGEPYSFSLVEYLQGDDAETALPNLPAQSQYRLGQDAGRELWRIHQAPARELHSNWIERRTRKYRLRLKQANDANLGFPLQDQIEQYIERNFGLLDRSKVCFQHDDYHPGNMIINNRAWAGIVDFNRCDQGDPVEEFYKVPWFTIRVSAPFARGQVDGYLESSAAADFWPRYNLFVAMNLHGSLVWERENSGVERQRQWLGYVQEIVATHDWLDNGPPQWYVG